MSPRARSTLRLIRLALHAIGEGLYSAFQVLTFALRSGREKERIRRLLEAPVPVNGKSGSASGGARRATIVFGSLALAGALLVGAQGCAARSGTFVGSGPVPGTSFGRQLDNTAESIEWLFAMDDAWDSLKFDVETLLDPEPEQFVETFQLLGW